MGKIAVADVVDRETRQLLCTSNMREKYIKLPFLHRFFLRFLLVQIDYKWNIGLAWAMEQLYIRDYLQNLF